MFSLVIIIIWPKYLMYAYLIFSDKAERERKSLYCISVYTDSPSGLSVLGVIFLFLFERVTFAKPPSYFKIINEPFFSFRNYFLLKKPSSLKKQQKIKPPFCFFLRNWAGLLLIFEIYI